MGKCYSTLNVKVSKLLKYQIQIKNLGNLVKILVFLMFLMSSFIYPIQIFAKTSAEVQEEINKKQQELDTLKKNLQGVQNQINSLNIQNQQTSSELDRMTIELQSVQLQIQYNLDKKIEINTEKTLRDMEVVQKTSEKENKIRLLYKATDSSSVLNTFLLSKNFDVFDWNMKTNKRLLSKDADYLKQLVDSIALLSNQQIEFDKLIFDLDKSNSELSQKKKDLEDRKNFLASQISTASNKKNQYSSQITGIEGTIGQLSIEQKKLLEAELAALNANNQIRQIELHPGDYFFEGRGRDLIEGHGLGMSQWGAYGMAYNYHWTYDAILKFYYTGVTIGDYKEPQLISVDGKPAIPFNDYLAGIGEVPDNWPAEAIKAQIVAARTYVMGVCGNKTTCSICGNANCQVYKGGTAKRTYVEQTKGKVILYNGAPIIAYYSASHRGYSTSLNSAWGSADKLYIQPVNDDAYAAKGYKSCNPYITNKCMLIETYNWIWRTNGYSLDKLSSLFKSDSRTNVGNLIRVDITRDVSKRVSRITLVGENGSKTFTGWNFRAIFNNISSKNGLYDYIYSTEFYLNKYQ